MCNERNLKARYLKINGKYELLNAYYEDLDENKNEKNVTKDYINGTYTYNRDTYNWDFSLDYSDIRSSVAKNYLENKEDLHFSGADFETECVIVDLKDRVLEENLRAIKFDVAIKKHRDGIECLCKTEPVDGLFNTSTNGFTET